MPHYLRTRTPGGTYFFTVNLADRRRALLVHRMDALRTAVRIARTAQPFSLLAIVVLPDHLHCLWRLPTGDHDIAGRWARIKSEFSRRIPAGEPCNESRTGKRERGIWQRRYWEHLIRDEGDFHRHADYIHHNPVKHGYVKRACDWPYSSFRQWVARGLYPLEWDSQAALVGQGPPYGRRFAAMDAISGGECWWARAHPTVDVSLRWMR